MYAKLLLHQEEKEPDSTIQRAAQYYINAHRAATNVPKWEKTTELTQNTLIVGNQMVQG